ncbi:calcium uptake protein, mitochondrial [Prosopis cineraria]|uniref:calcium uptake protein, mitochondrial n=1 Tax=Prosopis cineraria TaxID=364024 RepID=UPI00240F3918|nr:calcium uptake protein, mitochondrial [Prosopis cineraria]
MPSFSSLRTSSLSARQILIQRPLTRLSSTAPSSNPSSSSLPLLINTCNHGSDQQHVPASWFLLKWVSAIVSGSTLGILCWFSAPNFGFDSDFLRRSLAYADGSTARTDSDANAGWHRTRSLLRKLSLPERTDRLLFGDAFRRKVFFNYEKRIRLRSPPEKVFEYFASYRTPEGELLMKPADLMRAVVPVFPPSESKLVREGYLRGERSPGQLLCPPSDFFMLFDVNNDGLISFKEYIFFVTLLSIPESSFSVAFKMFDIDNNGEIDKEEFKKVMALMRSHNRQGAYCRGRQQTRLKCNDSVENGGLVEYFFGKDGKERLQLDRFIQFMRELDNEIIRLEFAHYDYKSRKSLSAKDFALSMVASADMNHLGRLLDRVEELNNDPSFREQRITFEEFKNFAELRKKLLPFSLALFSFGKANGLLTRADFQRAASHVCGVSLSDKVIDIVFGLFDTNRDGSLSSEEFLRVLHKRERDIAQPGEAGLFGFLSCCCRNCVDTLSLSRLLS